jgi:hypothetical protein
MCMHSCIFQFLVPHAPQRDAPSSPEDGDEGRDALRPARGSRDAVSSIRMKKYVQGKNPGVYTAAYIVINVYTYMHNYNVFIFVMLSCVCTVQQMCRCLSAHPKHTYGYTHIYVCRHDFIF